MTDFVAAHRARAGAIDGITAASDRRDAAASRVQALEVELAGAKQAATDLSGAFDAAKSALVSAIQAVP